ncbi:MAG: hypothetical protein COT45_02950 [bacterium (Candidatus Stahlbacteria) CG08_land_8_20_14_0_20_40_26]|nr:MAG: hypothetical protein COX49_01160 [bacterium (Candidatus Stahlbacteria) CG23_combo_of_CG06-09_8_20_14_all_40_9]PIS25188.1 MAG: hypothetical protein COT45_02950 [bacterium (Candidatus Stahlbacteria) CG08_land_8_20_14_0_20_40_26]
MIIIVILLIMMLGLFGIIGVIIIQRNQSMAKKKAKLILKAGKIENLKEFKQISKILATMRNDLEDEDLWRRLQKLYRTIE